MFRVVLIEPEIPCPVIPLRSEENWAMPSPYPNWIEDGMEYRSPVWENPCSM